MGWEGESFVLGESVRAVEGNVHVMLFRINPSDFLFEKKSSCPRDACAVRAVVVVVPKEPEVVHSEYEER